MPKSTRPIVIKYGGSLLATAKGQQTLLRQLKSLSMKTPIVLVHGGGKEISKWLDRVRIRSRFLNGLRYTDAAAMEVVEMVLSGKVNQDLVGKLSRLGVKAVGLSGRSAETVRAGVRKELGRAGKVTHGDAHLLTTLLQSGFTPVLSSVASDGKGQALNVNADEAAAAIAISLKALRLVLLTDVPGVKNSMGKVIPVIRRSDFPSLVKKGVITGGMIPKVRSALAAVARGVGAVQISGSLKPHGGTLIKS